MIEANLIYDPLQPGMVCTLPENWDELSAGQFLAIAAAIHETPPEETDLLHTRLVMALLPRTLKLWKRIAPESLVMDLFPLIEWIKDPCTMTRQLFPYVQCGLRRLYGPSEELGNLTMAEFDFAERWLFKWHSDRTDQRALYTFVACIYRDKRWFAGLRKNTGDVRVPFNDNLIDRYAGMLQKHLPFTYAYSIMMWYKGCRERLIASFPRVFPKNSDSKGGSSEPSYFGLMTGIAEKGTFGNFDEVERRNIWNTFYYLELTYKHNEEMIQKMEEKNQR